VNVPSYSAPTGRKVRNPAGAVACYGAVTPVGDALTGLGHRRGCSRRRFVAQGLVTMVTVPMLFRDATAAEVGPLRTPAERLAHGGANGAAAGDGSGVVHTAGAFDDRLTTTVYINGHGPYRFLVDTGAERTLIAAEVATQLALPSQQREVLLEGIIRSVPAALVDIASLRMGSLVCSALQVPTLPRKMLQADGFLGLDVLNGHRVVLDFRARTLTVTRPQGFFAALWAHWDEAVVHTLGSSGRLRATDCLVGNVRAAAFIDTGAEVSIMNPPLYAALRQSVRNRPLARGSVRLQGVTGGSIVGRTTSIRSIDLGDLRLTYTAFVVAALQVFDVWGLSRQPALLLGMDCLRRFARVSIDYGRKELHFEVASARAVRPLRAALPPTVVG
jgi:predicted aspartyl protease